MDVPNKVECPTCHGKKTVNTTVTTYGVEGSEAFVLKCVTCDGHGEVTPEYAAEFKRVWGPENWCSCEGQHPATHTVIHGQDYYKCDNCKKTVQIG